MKLILAYLTLIFQLSAAFTSTSKWSKSMKIASSTEDPNFLAHLPELLKRGLADREDPDLASELRSRYKVIENVKRKASVELKTINPELAAELEELADEMAETSEKFVQTALFWDAWKRPSPDLPSELRAKNDLAKKDLEDPNFAANLSKFLSAGRNEDRSSPNLPSDLRLIKYKQGVEVKRLASKELKTQNVALAEELDEIASEIEESHKRFEEMVQSMRKSRDSYESTSKSTR